KAEGAEACSALVGDESEFLAQSVSRLEPTARKAHLESALGIAARLGVHHELVTPSRGGEPDIGSRDGVAGGIHHHARQRLRLWIGCRGFVRLPILLASKGLPGDVSRQPE